MDIFLFYIKSLILTSLGLLLVIVVYGFQLVKWAKKQNSTLDIFLFQVRGRFSYYTVLEWINKIEIETPASLPEVSNYLEKIYRICLKKKKPIRLYKPKLDQLVEKKFFRKIKYYGVFFKRMKWPTKILMLLIMLWFLLPVIFMLQFSINVEKYPVGQLGGVIIGIVASIFFIPFWRLIRLPFKRALKNNKRNREDLGLLHEESYKLSSTLLGLIHPIPLLEMYNSKITGFDFVEESLKQIKKDFGGGSSTGSW